MSFFDRLFNKHKFIRRAALFWAAWLITYICIKVFEPEIFKSIDAAKATVITAMIGILTTVIAFYQWLRQHEDFQDELNSKKD